MVEGTVATISVSAKSFKTFSQPLSHDYLTSSASVAADDDTFTTPLSKGVIPMPAPTPNMSSESKKRLSSISPVEMLEET